MDKYTSKSNKSSWLHPTLLTNTSCLYQPLSFISHVKFCPVKFFSTRRFVRLRFSTWRFIRIPLPVLVYSRLLQVFTMPPRRDGQAELIRDSDGWLQTEVVHLPAGLAHASTKRTRRMCLSRLSWFLSDFERTLNLSNHIYQTTLMETLTILYNIYTIRHLGTRSLILFIFHLLLN